MAEHFRQNLRLGFLCGRCDLVHAEGECVDMGRCGCGCPLHSVVSAALGQCFTCRRKARKGLRPLALKHLASEHGEKAAQLYRQGLSVAADAWAHEARQVKRESEQRRWGLTRFAMVRPGAVRAFCCRSWRASCAAGEVARG